MNAFLLLAAAGAPSTGILGFFLEAGPVAKLVLFVLVVFSLASWSIILAKTGQLRRARRQNESFLRVFRQSARFSEINSAAPQHKGSPLVAMFQSGYLEIDAQVKSGGSLERTAYRIRSLSGVERALLRAMAAEMRHLQQRLPFLATTAAATPFIGLFGTVWGIMVAFNDIGATGSASIIAVAPGIAEALVNTAAGLIAAIPALIGYNQLASRLRQVKHELEDFALEFLNLAERNFT